MMMLTWNGNQSVPNWKGRKSTPKKRSESGKEMRYALFSAVDDVGVFDPNMENVLDMPLRLFFMKFAVAWDEDENSDDVAVDEAVEVTPMAPEEGEMPANVALLVLVVVTVVLLTIGVV